MERVPLTPTGKAKLAQELEQLKKVERPKIIEEISTARAHGDLSENAEYHAAKEKQSHIEGRILMLEDQLSRVEVIDPSKLSTEKVVFGMSVRLIDVETEEERLYRIVGDYEADLESGSVSVNSPIAKALIGREVGEEARVHAPGGKRSYEITEIFLEA